MPARLTHARQNASNRRRSPPVHNPDCGLKTRAWPETRTSLENLVSAARTVRAELSAS
ncbi:hypothetical protein ACGFZQ_15945 [Streptomyces sp. NPDC048254]|uniref:hypothetical protein n=1 Tax=Streptomyces sp. NPDC048254 TaxID=3365525 RepID=UPI0037103928